MEEHKIILGDSRLMGELEDGSVHLVVTSPPYWQLKDYGEGNQIGYNDSYSDYINHLNLVWNECFRVLHDGCKLCINIGDQFARSVYYGGYRVIPIRTEIIKFCEARGFSYMGAVIWQKATSMNTTGGGSVMGSYPYPRNGIIKIDYEFILLFKKPGKGPKVSKERKDESRMTKDEWNEYFSGHWRFAGARQKGHLAMFPVELPRRLIKMFTFKGETVLDPFLGSGTTTLAAVEQGRTSVGYELNEEFLTVIKEKLGWGEPAREAKFELIHQQKDLKIDFESKINELPYVYRPEHDIERSVDPKDKRFGQKIDGTGDEEREEYHSVKKILNPELVVLDNGTRVRLIGIKKDDSNTDSALKLLKNMFKGTRIYLKHDESREYDEDQNLLSYIYLKNRTFVNLHLIKSGFVNIDDSWDYKNKDKFLSLKNSNGN